MQPPGDADDRDWSMQGGGTIVQYAIFLEHRLDASPPDAMKFFQQLLGRRDAARDIVLDRMQIAALVLAAGVQPPTPRKSLARERERGLRKVQHVAPRDRGGETELRHVVTKFLPLLRRSNS